MLKKMKILVVLLAVILGMASSASGNIVEDIELRYNEENFTVTVVGLRSMPKTTFGIEAISGQATISEPLMIHYAAGDLADIGFVSSAYAWSGLFCKVHADSTSVEAGNWFTFGYVPDGTNDTFNIYDISGNGYEAPSVGQISLTAASVPEPASAGLLGLGGLLFVRRRHCKPTR